MNPLYQQLAGQEPVISNQNPMQRFDMIRQMMVNPGLIIKRRFPDMPDNILNDPNEMLRYLKQTRGITDQQIQQLINTFRR